MTNPDLPAMLFTYGPLGIVLAWFMMRGESKLDRVADRLDRLAHKIEGVTRAMLADVISREDADSRAREIARNMLSELDAQRKDPPSSQP